MVMETYFETKYRGVYVEDNMPHATRHKDRFSWVLDALHWGIPEQILSWNSHKMESALHNVKNKKN